jgi:hypothetical protein
MRITSRRATAGAALVVAAACDDMWTLEPSAERVPIDQIIAISRTLTGVLRADTTSAETIVVRLPRDADKRVVTFTTTFGWFAETAREKKVDVRAVLESSDDSVLTARVVLRSDTLRTGGVVDTAVVRATVDQFSNSVRVPFARGATSQTP